MKLLIKSQYRKIMKNVLYFVSISLVLFFISFTYTSFKTSVLRLESNYDSYLETQNVDDFYMMIGEIDITYLGADGLIELCNTYDVEDECARTIFFPDDEILLNNVNHILNTKIEENPEPYENLIDSYILQFERKFNLSIEKIVTANYIVDEDKVFKFRSTSDTIDIPYLIEGRLPLSDNEITLYPEYMKHNNLKINDTFTVGNTSYTIVGSAYAPDYVLPILSSNQVKYIEEEQSIILATERTIKNIGIPYTLRYTGKGNIESLFDGYSYNNIYSSDYSKLGKEMGLLEFFVPRELNFRISALKDEVRLANLFINSFLSVFMILSVFLILIFMKKYIEKNKNDILILSKLGRTKNEITIVLLTLPFLASISLLIGHIVGIIYSTNLYKLYSNRYYFPKGETYYSMWILITSTILPIIGILLITYLFIQKEITFKKTIPKTRIPFTKFTPLKTQIMSFTLFLIISVLIIFGINSRSLFDDFSATTLQGNNYSKFVLLKSMSNDALEDGEEGFTRFKTTITKINGETVENLGSYLYGIKPDTSLKVLLNNNQSSNQLVQEGIIISDYFSEVSNLRVGDTVEFTVGATLLTRQVKGISNELVESNMFIDLATVNQLYDLDGSYYNGVFLSSETYDIDNVKQVVDYEDSLNEMVEIFNISSSILIYITTLSILLGLYIFVIIIFTYIDDNIKNIATLKALGYSNLEILNKYMIIPLIIAVLSYIIAIPISQILLDWFVNLIVIEMGFKFIISLNSYYIFYGFMILLILYNLVLYIAVKYFNKADISVLLKEE